MYRQLIVRLGDQIVLTSTISKHICTIGRLPDNDLVLPHVSVSPHHAEIHLESEGMVFTDLDSAGGSVVDGVRLLSFQPTPLRDGGVIEVGSYVIVYRSELEKTASPSTVPAPETSGTSSSGASRLKPKRSRVAPLSGVNSNHVASSYLQYLPIIFHDSDFLGRYLRIFETIWEPLEQRQDHISMYFDPRTCPLEFLPWFAGWFGLTIDPHWPEERLRALLAEAIELYRWRGTKYGLTRMIEVCTGAKPEIVELPSEPFVFRIRVRLPQDSGVKIDYLEELIRTHKPAHTGYFLEVL